MRRGSLLRREKKYGTIIPKRRDGYEPVICAGERAHPVLGRGVLRRDPPGRGDRFHGGGHSDLLVRQQAGGVLSVADGLFRHGGEPVSEAAVPDSPALGPGP